MAANISMAKMFDKEIMSFFFFSKKIKNQRCL